MGWIEWLFKENSILKKENASLKKQFELFRRKIFGQRSRKIIGISDDKEMKKNNSEIS